MLHIRPLTTISMCPYCGLGCTGVKGIPSACTGMPLSNRGNREATNFHLKLRHTHEGITWTLLSELIPQHWSNFIHMSSGSEGGEREICLCVRVSILECDLNQVWVSSSWKRREKCQCHTSHLNCSYMFQWLGRNSRKQKPVQVHPRDGEWSEPLLRSSKCMTWAKIGTQLRPV